ncbi:MAG: hypothetical protein ACHQE5_01195, partial [Actinomycetes bacterium]
MPALTDDLIAKLKSPVPPIDFPVGALKFRPLETWLQDASRAEVQCRISGLTIRLRAGVALPDYKLLPWLPPDPTAELTFTIGGAAPKSKVPVPFDLVQVDDAQGTLKAVLNFPADDHTLYQEVVQAMTAASADITVTIHYQAWFTRLVSGSSTPPQVHMYDRDVLRSIQMTRVDSAGLNLFNTVRELSAPQPAAQPVVQPGPARESFAPGTLAAVRVDRFRAGEADRPAQPAQPPPRPDPPPPTPTPQPQQVALSLPIKIDRRPGAQPDQPDPYPDLPKPDSLGDWSPFAPPDGSPAVFFKSTGRADEYYYVPTSFQLGFYADDHDSAPPIAAEAY